MAVTFPQHQKPTVGDFQIGWPGAMPRDGAIQRSRALRRNAGALNVRNGIQWPFSSAVERNGWPGSRLLAR